MRTEVRYKWRTLWAGKWGTTRYHATEEEIRKQHPEAIRLDATRQEITLPETPEELARGHDSGALHTALTAPRKP